MESRVQKPKKLLNRCTSIPGLH